MAALALRHTALAEQDSMKFRRSTAGYSLGMHYKNGSCLCHILLGWWHKTLVNHAAEGNKKSRLMRAPNALTRSKNCVK
jgi:hypothetical protein